MEAGLVTHGLRADMANVVAKLLPNGVPAEPLEQDQCGADRDDGCKTRMPSTDTDTMVDAGYGRRAYMRQLTSVSL